MAVSCHLNFRILYGHNKDIRREFGNSALVDINPHTCRWIARVIAKMLLFVRQCFTVLSNKWDRFWIKHFREETKDMTKPTAHYHLTHSITMST
jgi:hypothetical protein